MNDDSLWQQLSVKNFFNSCNWNDKSTPQLLLKKHDLKFWQLLSVAKFFEFHNWNGSSIVTNNHHRNLAFSLSLTVPDFWQQFNWIGKKDNQENESEPISLSSEVNLLSAQGNSIKPQQTISVNDLSQLF